MLTGIVHGRRGNAHRSSPGACSDERCAICFTADYTVVLTDFIASGGDGYTNFSKCSIVTGADQKPFRVGVDLGVFTHTSPSPPTDRFPRLHRAGSPRRTDVDVTFVDGKRKRVHFFASRLKYSRFVAVSLVDNERVETVVRGLARHFVAFGGLPLMAVFDRPRTIVKKAGKGRDVEQFNATFAQAIVDIGVGVEMCAPRSGNQKGTVERLVGWVKSSFFKHRKFQDDADLRAQLALWQTEVNTKTPSRATGVIPETRRLEELARLRPIKVFPEKLALRVPIFVGPTAEVMFEGLPYSMPPEATHIAGTLFLYEDHLRILAGRFEAHHRRRNKGDPPSPLPEHRAAKIAAVHGKRAKLYEKRQQVLNLGPDALALLTEITHREPKLASRRVEDLYVLLDKHGDDAMREALGRAVRSGALSVAGVARALRTLGARRSEGSRLRSGAAQPRGQHPHQFALPIGRAESKGGAS